MKQTLESSLGSNRLMNAAQLARETLPVAELHLHLHENIHKHLESVPGFFCLKYQGTQSYCHLRVPATYRFNKQLYF